MHVAGDTVQMSWSKSAVVTTDADVILETLCCVVMICCSNARVLKNCRCFICQSSLCQAMG